MSRMAEAIRFETEQTRVIARNTVNVLSDTERTGYTVIEVSGHQDDNTGQGQYHREAILEVHEDQQTAVNRVTELNATQSEETFGNSAGDGVVMWYRHFKTGEVLLHLCLVETEPVEGV